MDYPQSDSANDGDTSNTKISVALCVVGGLVFWTAVGFVWFYEGTPDCEAPDASLHSHSAWGPGDRYIWDGDECKLHLAGECYGDDCHLTYEDRQSCEEAYAHCTAE